MGAAQLPENEQLRLAELSRLKVLDSEPEDRFDRITDIAAEITGAPIVLVSLVDRDRQWFKSRHGLDATETPREGAFCAHAILGSDVFIVADATRDDRFRDNPLVVGPPHIRTYAGAPLVMENGCRLGTLCAIFTEVTEIPELWQRQLARLASLVVDALELRHMRRIFEHTSRIQTREKQRFRDIAETIADWLWETDDRHRFTLSSDARGSSPVPIHHVLGRTRWEVAGIDPRDPGMREHVAMLESHVPFRDFEFEYIDSEGRRACRRVSGNPIFAEDGAFLGYRGATTDTTSEKEALDALSGAKDKAEIANRAKSEFLANMSHELRTPLNAINGFSEILRRELHGPLGHPTYLGYVEHIHESGTLLLQIINDILDLTRLETERTVLEYRPVNVRDLFGRTLSMMSMEAEKRGLDLTVRYDGNIPDRISTDEQRLNQILVNLLSNALKFTEEGSVQVAVSWQEGAPRGTLTFAVTDTGIGIPAGAQATIFDRFAQVESSAARKFGGTGLGLAISSDLATLMGGRIAVSSAPGSGSTFEVCIPAASAEAGSAVGAGENAKPPR